MGRNQPLVMAAGGLRPRQLVRISEKRHEAAKERCRRQKEQGASSQPKPSSVQSAVGCVHQESDSTATNQLERTDHHPSQKSLSEKNQPSSGTILHSTEVNSAQVCRNLMRDLLGKMCRGMTVAPDRNVNDIVPKGEGNRAVRE